VITPIFAAFVTLALNTVMVFPDAVENDNVTTLPVVMFAVFAYRVLIEADVLTFKLEPVPATSRMVFAVNVAPLPFVRVFAVAIKSCVAINHCWKVLEVVSWVIGIIWCL